MTEAKKVLQLIEGSWFEDWYASDFEDYITGEDGAKSKEQILADLERKLEFIK